MSVEHLSSDNFKEKTASGVVLIDFFADWCGPCKMIAPTIEALAADYAGKATVAKINVDEAGDIAQQFGVMSIPTLIFFKDGKEVKRLMGNMPKEQLAEALGGLL